MPAGSAETEKHSNTLTSPTTPAAKAGLGSKLFYGSGAASFGIADAGFAYFLLIYYNQVLGLDAFLTGLALALAVLIDAVSDIAVGFLSDNWVSKLGRRHPFMYAAAVPAAISFYYLWNPPSSFLQSDNLLFTYLLLMTVLVRSCLTFFEVPNAAMGPELTKNYDDRTRLMGYRYVFGWFGGLTIAVLTYRVLLPSDAAGQLGPNGYQLLGMVASAAMLVMMLTSALGTQRAVAGFHKPATSQQFKFGLIKAAVTGMFSNRSFVSLFVSALFLGAAAGLSQAMSIYISTFFWRLSSTEISYIPLLGLVAVPTSFVIAPRLASRLGKKRAAMHSFLFAIGFMPLAYAAQIAGIFPDQGGPLYLPLIMLNYLVATTAIIVMQIVFSSMNADVVEDRSVETQGQRNEGLIFAARNFAKKAVSGLGILLAGLVLWLAGFPEQATPDQIGDSTTRRLILIYLPCILGLYLASWYAIRNYRIDRARHEENLRQQS